MSPMITAKSTQMSTVIVSMATNSLTKLWVYFASPVLFADAGGAEMSEVLNMGGYAAFVWPAYAVSALGLGAAILLTLRGYARAKTRLDALEKP